MLRNKSFKYRIYPNLEQEQLFAQTFGCVRKAWNLILDWRSKEYQENKSKISYKQTSEKLTVLKASEEYKWLNDVSSVALQQTLRNQDKALGIF
ncbi:Helix-turn-helix domain-containing protein [Candidatus Hepatincolaceae symbiont of Richtersius coronifer]